MLADWTPIRKKNNCGFQKVIFRRQKIFCGKSSFCKKNQTKIRIFGNEGYCLKEKNEPDFSTSSPWKSNRNYGRKNLFMENGKKIIGRVILRLIFPKLSEKVPLNINHRCLKYRKNPSKI